MARAVWNGAIVFGLVNVPVELYPGAADSNLDFDWIDRRDMAPVGYQRINKLTGEVLEGKNIVKGYQYEKGRYVTLDDDDFRLANPKATQTVEIVTFAAAGSILPQFFETPYRLVPGKRGEKGTRCCAKRSRNPERSALRRLSSARSSIWRLCSQSGAITAGNVTLR
ncbi:MAG: Ku protein [Casimicrobiaceae bacterium]